MYNYLIAALMFLALDARAADWILAADTVDVRAGAPVDVDVLYAGTGSVALPDRLSARANAGGRTWTLELRAAGRSQGARRRYATDLPVSASGIVVLDLVSHASSKLALVARGPGPDPVAQLVEPRPAPIAAPAEGTVPAGLLEPVLSAHEPMYFLIGTRQGTSARYQISFKYRLFDDDSGWGRDRQWLTGFYFAYTQNSLWDLSSQSKPFRDTSYRPSAFWQWQRTDDKTWVDAARVGLEHESNGKDGTRSRSVNTAFVQPVWRWKLADERVLTFDPKLIGYLEKSENSDIQKYRGYADWRVRAGREDGLMLASTVRTGTSGRGSIQVDASYPSRDELFGRIGGYWHVQYFNGYGEDILGYNQKRDAQVRFGFSIVR